MVATWVVTAATEVAPLSCTPVAIVYNIPQISAAANLVGKREKLRVPISLKMEAIAVRMCFTNGMHCVQLSAVCWELVSTKSLRSPTRSSIVGSGGLLLSLVLSSPQLPGVEKALVL